MKVTIDSSEPLDDALRVLGALYDVTLVVSPSVAGSLGEELRTSRRSRFAPVRGRPAGGSQGARPPDAERARWARATERRSRRDRGAAHLGTRQRLRRERPRPGGSLGRPGVRRGAPGLTAARHAARRPAPGSRPEPLRSRGPRPPRRSCPSRTARRPTRRTAPRRGPSRDRRLTRGPVRRPHAAAAVGCRHRSRAAAPCPPVAAQLQRGRSIGVHERVGDQLAGQQ